MGEGTESADGGATVKKKRWMKIIFIQRLVFVHSLTRITSRSE